MLDSERLKIVNNRGETYLLHPNYAEFGVLAIEGLSQPDATVNISESGTTDGGKFNSAHIGVRDIVIHLVMFGWTEAERKKLYRMFPAKSAVELYYRNSQYNVKTTGYVKHIDPVPYYDKTRVRIELVCPDPYLHAVDSITAETAGNPPAVILVNTADCEIGFTAEVSIDTNETPTLARTITQGETADYLRQHFLWWNWGAFNTFVRDTMSLNIYIDDEYQVPGTDYTYDLLSVVYTDLWLTFPDGKLAGGKKITAEILVIDGETWTDLRSYTKTESVTGTGGTRYFNFYDIPSNLDVDTWQMKFYLNGNEFVEGTDFVLTKHDTYLELNTSTITGGHTFATGDTVKMDAFYSESNANVKSKTINRYSTTISSLNPFVDAILDPDLGDYDDAKDILLINMGDARLTDEEYELVTATSQIDGETHTMLQMANGGRISRKLTFDVISSLVGDDIREYSESEIDDGLLLVNNLSIKNRITGEEMKFPGVQFQKGDKFTVSTVSGHLKAVVTESTWMPTGTSLLAEVIQNGTFFKLQPGENIVQLNATTNYTFVSAEFTVEMLYGGV
jgi:hypothetical protein